jgi:hypothetical protein
MDSMDTAMPSGEYPAEEKQPSGGEIASADGDSTSESSTGSSSEDGSVCICGQQRVHGGW